MDYAKLLNDFKTFEKEDEDKIKIEEFYQTGGEWAKLKANYAEKDTIKIPLSSQHTYDLYIVRDDGGLMLGRAKRVK